MTTLTEAERASTAAANLVAQLAMIYAALESIETRDPELAATGFTDPADLVDASALIQDLRRRLDQVENSLTTEAGKRDGKGTGNLSDGRQYVLARGSDRKDWDHDDWKRDVRRTITDMVAGEGLVVVNPQTGEETPLRQTVQVALAKAQEVHGQTSPRSTALKALGLYASDYCTSTPAGWRLTVKPANTTTTATEK